MANELTRLEQFALVLLRHSAFDEFGALRTWKGYDWDIMNRLHEKGLISNPHGRAKSVLFTEEGERQANELLTTLLGIAGSGAPSKDRRER